MGRFLSWVLKIAMEPIKKVISLLRSAETPKGRRRFANVIVV